MWRDQDNGYSSLEDENQDGTEHSAEQTPSMVIDAALARLRTRAGCQEDSFVRQLSTSLLSRMARNIFRNWESALCAVEDGQRPEMPDFLEIVTEVLRRFAQRSEVTEEYDRRNARGSMEHNELEEQRRRERGDFLRSPRRRLSHSRSMEDPTLDLDILQPVAFRSSPDSPMSPAKGLADPEKLRSFQRMEPMRMHRRRYSKQAEDDVEKEERRRLRRMRKSSLESSLSPRASYESSLQKSKEEEVRPSEEREISGEEHVKSEDKPSTGAEGSASPEESSTPSEELLTSVEENSPAGEAASEDGARPKVAPKDKDRRKKRTRKILEGMSNRQISSLRHLSITRMDAMEMIIQLSVSMDRLDRLLNGSRRRENPAPEVDETMLSQFFDSLEVTRTREIENGVSAEDSEDSSSASSSSIPKVTEDPQPDPRKDDA